ncbi:MAG: DUF4091 domain-containing protein [bacterium]|nr:DUF4091 domain-containing protein [bacterium]
MSFLLMWKYGLTGNLYWCVRHINHIGDVPLVNPGADGRGDGMLAYVYQSRTVPSLRLETIRDGVEDYEYLWLLADRVRKAEAVGQSCPEVRALLTIPDSVARDMGHYSHDPKPLEVYRWRIAEAIEALGD